MNPSNPKFSSIVPKCLKSEDPEAEIFLRNHDLVLAIENFMSQRTELWKVMLLENLAGEVIELIQNLVVSLEASENWKEATFWRSQIVRLHYQTDKLYRLWDDCPGSEAEASKMVVGLDCEGFEKVKGDVNVDEYRVKAK